MNSGSPCHTAQKSTYAWTAGNQRWRTFFSGALFPWIITFAVPKVCSISNLKMSVLITLVSNSCDTLLARSRSNFAPSHEGGFHKDITLPILRFISGRWTSTTSRSPEAVHHAEVGLGSVLALWQTEEGRNM